MKHDLPQLLADTQSYAGYARMKGKAINRLPIDVAARPHLVTWALDSTEWAS